MRLRVAENNSKDKDLSRALYMSLGFRPKNIDLYKKAFRHRSAAKETEDSNERLEFLGDAVLGLVAGEAVYIRYPRHDEGYLTQMRSRIVSRESLNKIAESTGLCDWIEVRGKDAVSRNIGANMFEALVGAIYLDIGFRRCREVLRNHLLEQVDWGELECTETDYKSRMVERCQKKGRPLSFRVEMGSSQSGEPSLFIAEALVDGHVLGRGEGHTKKDAEQEASRQAWLREFNRGVTR